MHALHFFSQFYHRKFKTQDKLLLWEIYQLLFNSTWWMWQISYHFESFQEGFSETLRRAKLEKLRTFKNSAFILSLSHIKISIYAEPGARVYEAFYEILTICQKSTEGVLWCTFSKSGYSIKDMAYKDPPSFTAEGMFVNTIFVNKLNLDLLYFL